MISTVSLEGSFDYCQRIARRHYENFPVASFFLPKHIRPHVAAIYAFARTADDFADEENRPASERLDLLADWQSKLEECYGGTPTHPIFIALSEVTRQKEIPKQLLADLLTAFRMDVTTHRYPTFSDLLRYCQLSANPIGRLVLHLFDDATERNCRFSDSICTALQLANFWQDVSVDLRKNRIYVPLEDIARFGYTETEFHRHTFNGAFRSLMEFEVERTKQMFETGKPLLREVTPKLRFELNLTWNGGMAIVRKMGEGGYNVFEHRPTISGGDRFSILLKSFFRTA